MRTAKFGDKVQVHYVGRLQRGQALSSRGGPPVLLTVGTDHPRLPGLGLALAGLAVGEQATVQVTAEHAFGMGDPRRVRTWSRKRLPGARALRVGSRVRFVDGRGRRRSVRILARRGDLVVVDTNHRWAGQSLRLEVEVLAIEGPSGSAPEPDDREGAACHSDRTRALAFDVDPASLAALREALPDWRIDVFHGANVARLPAAWDPGPVSLLVLGLRLHAADSLALCGLLAAGNGRPTLSGGQGEAPRPDALILALLPPGHDDLVAATLEAGAHRCLLLPLSAMQVASAVASPPAGERPGRHTLNLAVAQDEDRWRDDGGQG